MKNNTINDEFLKNKEGSIIERIAKVTESRIELITSIIALGFFDIMSFKFEG